MKVLSDNVIYHDGRHLILPRCALDHSLNHSQRLVQDFNLDSLRQLNSGVIERTA